MNVSFKLGPLPLFGGKMAKKCTASKLKVFDDDGGGGDGQFPSFLPKEVEKIKDPFARSLAKRIERLPVQIGYSESCIMSSCVKPLIRQSNETTPVVLLHCFDSSCLEWRCTLPLLEEAGLEAWAIDVLGWGFSDLESRPPCDVASKRHHLYQLWKSYIRRPIILVGPSLGASVAIDFTVHYPEAVEKLVLINPSVYAEGTGHLAKLPELVAYAGVSFLKSLPLRLYANMLAFNSIPFLTILDWTNVGRLHCFLPWWKDSTVSFMFSGGYNVISQIKQVQHIDFHAEMIRKDSICINLLCIFCINSSFNNESLQMKSFHFIFVLAMNFGYLWLNWDPVEMKGMNRITHLHSIENLLKVKHKTLLICGEKDQIVSYKLVVKLHSELSNAIIREVSDSGHLPHVDNPKCVAKLIANFAEDDADVDDKRSFCLALAQETALRR
ncbi:hypothetical protein DKX38_005961 [Salix brachista]|uniref:AB hydrolase-1 domain-containing protein n=1 Tax=Salix brachista TaxID=2182728 RepID=A0A5N5N0V4_9ROSI|nr:hypothetical protein DKX38_005961 [Salix brachista]